MWTFLGGMAAATTVLSFLFYLANNYIIGKIGLEVASRLADFGKALDGKYVTKGEIEIMSKAADDTHKRQDDDLARIWEMIKDRRT